MAIIFYCHKCDNKIECETKSQMICDCGHYVKDHDDTRNYVNMRTTWSNTTKVEFTPTTIEQDIADRNAK